MVKKGLPVESGGLGPLICGGGIIGVVRGVTDESAYLVEDFKPTLYELEVLAEHYLEEARWIDFQASFLGYSGSYEIRMRPFAYRRLATIEYVLGKERFQKAIASTKEDIDRKFAKAEEVGKNLEPCKQCGAKRTYYHHVFHPDGYCDGCDPASGQLGSDLNGPRVPVTEEVVDRARQWVEKNERQTEAHISSLKEGKSCDQ